MFDKGPSVGIGVIDSSRPSALATAITVSTEAPSSEFSSRTMVRVDTPARPASCDWVSPAVYLAAARAVPSRYGDRSPRNCLLMCMTVAVCDNIVLK